MLFPTRISLAASGLLVFLAVSAVRAGTNDFQIQTITLPVHTRSSRFADVDNDRRSDLLAVDSVEKRLLIYRQRASGFTNVPDQVIALPRQTAWIAVHEVDTQPGAEIVMSTVNGIVYYRQNGRAFESEPRTLIKADQVFTSNDSPGLISLGTNAAIPVISATHAVQYRRNDAGEWTPGKPTALEDKQTTLHTYRDEWFMGENPSRNLQLRQSFQSRPPAAEGAKVEPDAIGKFTETMNQADPHHFHLAYTNRVDLNRDGQIDLILWQVLGQRELKTDVYVFLRGPDGRLPERPTQVVHCRGLVMPIGSTEERCPVGDLKGDGTYQLVLLELRSTLTSVGSMLEMALTRGMELGLTIRPFSRGAFSGGQEPALIVTSVMPVEAMREWPVFICGDFNGDGRPDFVVRRSTTQWNIFCSTTDGRWFAPQPALTFEAPTEGFLEIHDLNGDGRSDLVLRSWKDSRVVVFFTPSPPMKGRNP